MRDIVVLVLGAVLCAGALGAYFGGLVTREVAVQTLLLSSLCGVYVVQRALRGAR